MVTIHQIYLPTRIYTHVLSYYNKFSLPRPGGEFGENFPWRKLPAIRYAYYSTQQMYEGLTRWSADDSVADLRGCCWTSCNFPLKTFLFSILFLVTGTCMGIISFFNVFLTDL